MLITSHVTHVSRAIASVQTFRREKGKKAEAANPVLFGCVDIAARHRSRCSKRFQHGYVTETRLCSTVEVQNRDSKKIQRVERLTVIEPLRIIVVQLQLHQS